MKTMVRVVAGILSLVLLLSFLPGTLSEAQAEDTNASEKSRTIHVVMDDSWSMVMKDRNFGDVTGEALTRWAQARYSLMVMAGMLNENDQMKIYYLSSWVGEGSREPLIISGSDSSQKRINTVRSYIPLSGGTPSDALLAAAADLKESTSDELYLLVISDGQFDNQNAQDLLHEIEGNAPENKQVIFLGIGDNAPVIEGGFKASDVGNEILNQVVDIGNLIFGRLNVPSQMISNYTFDTDGVGIGRLIVFAQGEGVNIKGLENNGEHITPTQKTDLPTPEPKEAARYLADSPDVEKIRTDTRLAGAIAEFNRINPGEVKLLIENATEVSFYFEPDFQVGLQLTNTDTGDVFHSTRTGDMLRTGTYRVEFGPINEDGQFIQSALLGNTNQEPELLESTFSTENWSQDMVQNGSEIQLPAGTLQVEIRQLFLNRFEKVVSLPTDSAGFSIFNEFLTLEAADTPTFDLKALDGNSIDIRITNEDGTEITQTDWNSLTDFSVKSAQEIGLEIRKGSEPGVLTVTVNPHQDDIFQTDTGEIQFTVTATLHDQEGNTRSGNTQSTFTIIDSLTFLERFVHWAIGYWWVLTLLILASIWGLFKFKQKKLPKIPPTTKGKVEEQFGGKSVPLNSSYKTNKWKNLLWPFQPQTATFKPWPSAVPFKLEATSPDRSSKLLVLNSSSFCYPNTRWKINGRVCELDRNKELHLFKGNKVELFDSVNEKTYVNKL